MPTQVRPFLMFESRAEEAMRFYVSLFPGAQVLEDRRWPDGRIMKAAFTIAGQTVLCTDSPAKHAFTFTPSISLFVDCQDEAELRRLVAALSEGGGVLMPLADYGFSRLFAWVSDRFGVSWQLNLPHPSPHA